MITAKPETISRFEHLLYDAENVNVTHYKTLLALEYFFTLYLSNRIVYTMKYIFHNISNFLAIMLHYDKCAYNFDKTLLHNLHSAEGNKTH